MLLYGSKLPANPTFAPDYDTVTAEENARSSTVDSLWNAARDLQIYRDNANAEDNAIIEAYERRNREIFDATGVQLPNPRRDFTGDLQEANRLIDSGGDPWALMADAERRWSDQVAQLARERPEHARAIGAGRAIRDDAAAIARGAETTFTKANADASAAGVGGLRSTANVLGGGIAGMLRDPLQVATLFVGGGVSGPARGVVGRVLQTMLTEAAVNAGVEAGVQAAAYDWKKSAGVEAGLGPSLQQVGLAALFGGGVGGLIAGGREVFRLTAKTVPEQVLVRAADGDAQPGDLPAIAEALGIKFDQDTLRTAELASEQADLDRAAFGAAPELVTEARAERMAAEAVRSIENPERIPRDEAIDRIVRSEFPLGPEPRRPVTLTQFLASRAVGGLRDDGGELAAMGLTRKFVPGGGALVRQKGKTLDMAREAAAEAGYFDATYGTPERATAESTTDDLLRALRQEAAGDPVFSPRNDGGRIFDWQQYETDRQRQAAYRRVVEEVDGAIDELGIEHRLDDAILRRAADLVDDDIEAVDALERALDEDYRLNAEAEVDLGEQSYDDFDIPFFDDRQDAGAMPRAGEAAAGPGDGGAPPGERGSSGLDGQQLPSAGGDEGTQGSQPLRRPGDTPEPGTAEAAETAELVLLEAAGGKPVRAANEGNTPLDLTPPEDFPVNVFTSRRHDAVEAVKNYLFAKLANRSVVNANDGAEILFTPAGLRHFFRRGAKTPRPALASALRLEELARTARYVGSAPDNKGRAEIVAVHFYEREATLGANVGNVRIVVREDRSGRRYYDHFTTKEDGGSAVGDRTPEGNQSGQQVQEPPPSGNIGLSDGAGKSLDIWDAMPAAKDADGTTLHTTHADMIADADRSEFLGDLISSCKD